jgi:hypothetical protein
MLLYHFLSDLPCCFLGSSRPVLIQESIEEPNTLEIAEGKYRILRLLLRDIEHLFWGHILMPEFLNFFKKCRIIGEVGLFLKLPCIKLLFIGGLAIWI